MTGVSECTDSVVCMWLECLSTLQRSQRVTGLSKCNDSHFGVRLDCQRALTVWAVCEESVTEHGQCCLGATGLSECPACVVGCDWSLGENCQHCRGVTGVSEITESVVGCDWSGLTALSGCCQGMNRVSESTDSVVGCDWSVGAH